MDANVLVVYVEPLLVDRSVLYIGDANAPALTRVVGQAREVLALDTGGKSRRNRLPGGRILPYEPGALAELEGGFEAIVVLDVTVFEDVEAALDDCARLLSRRGRLVLGLDAERARFDHEQLWDELAMRFDVVRFSGVSAVTAAAVAELGADGAREVVVDGSLVREPPPLSRFVAVASQADFDLDGYLLVQLEQDPSSQPALERLRKSEEKLAAAETKATTLRAERDAEREQRRRLEVESREALQKVERRLRDAETSLRGAPSAEELARLEEQLAAQAERSLELESEVERRGRLVRELVEDARSGAAPSFVGADPLALDQAIERALRAEAEREQMGFQVDELRARLADASEAAVTALKEREASFAGRAAGLAMRLAELEAHNRDLETELDLVRNSPSQHLADLARSADDAETERDVARAENLALVAQVAALETHDREHRERLVARLADLVGDPALGSIEDGFARVDALVESMRGELRGLTMRLDSLETAAPAPMPVQRRASDAPPPPEVTALRLENEALSADLRETKEALRAASAASAATRDALVERLQVELADAERRASAAEDREGRADAEVNRLREALVEAAVDVEAHEALARKVAGLERDLRDAIAAAEAAARDARSLRAQVEAGARALEDTRAILRALEAEAVPAGRDRPRAGLVDEAVDALASAPVAEGDMLVRSLTAQLEERDDRLRALERQIAGERQGDEATPLRSEVLFLEERLSRLSDDLAAEREARRTLEARAAQAGASPVPPSVAEVRKELEERSRALDEARVRADGSERDVRALRDAIAEARKSVEAVLGGPAADDPAVAGRLGEILTVLERY